MIDGFVEKILRLEQRLMDVVINGFSMVLLMVFGVIANAAGA